MGFSHTQDDYFLTFSCFQMNSDTIVIVIAILTMMLCMYAMPDSDLVQVFLMTWVIYVSSDYSIVSVPW